MYKKAFIILLLFCSLLSYAQPEPWSRIRIYLDNKDFEELARTGVELTQLNRKEGWAQAELSSCEIRLLHEKGFRIDVLIPDMQKYYVDRNAIFRSNPENLKQQSTMSDEWPVPANFTLGSCGGFLTVDDMLDQLDLMRSLYPGLITAKHSICDSLTSIEGDSIYFVRISDNPDVSENEPQILYTGMHHAREPMGMQHLLYYMWYLLENYNTNEDIKAVVDNTEMYFIPVLNVDGYNYNIQTNPLGGGMWRKNRRNSGGGNFGIDLNRNYAYMWGYDDVGSSPDPASDLYRGTGPFSEPETRMIRNFCEAHEFRIALNYHSYSNLFLNPWGWTTMLTPDETLFSSYAAEITLENNYVTGPGSSTLYFTNGGSDDWMYGEQTTKPKILSWTPEVGTASDGFWPSEDRIIPLCKENMWASLTAARLIGKYGKISDATPFFIWQQSGHLNFEVKRLGMQEGDFTASIEPLGDAFALIGEPVVISNLALLEKKMDSIPYQLNLNLQAGDTIRYVLVLDNGLYLLRDTVMRIWGYPYPLFEDHLDNKNNWTGSWNTTQNSYFTPPSSMTDSPIGNYPPNILRNTTLTNPINIPISPLIILEFRAHWALEAGYDFVQAKVTNDNGAVWFPLEGKYTHPGGLYQYLDQPLYDGSKTEWIREDISLNDFQDQNIKLRFTLVSDWGTELDGFYFDDVVISALLDPTSVDEQLRAGAWLGLPTPNPAVGDVTIKYRVCVNTPYAEINVFNAGGQSIFHRVITNTSGQVVIPTSTLPAGMYCLTLSGPDFPKQVRKLVVGK